MNKKKQFSGYNLKKTLPEDLIERDNLKGEEQEVAAFMLVLAATYNDIKGLTFLHDHFTRSYRKPRPGEVSEHSGEYNGLQLQLLKILIAQLHEFFELLRKQTSVRDTNTFKQILMMLSKHDYMIWEDLCDIANDTNSAPKEQGTAFLKTLIAQVRNNASYHLSLKCLTQGYRYHFYKTQNEHDGHTYAYFSGNKTDFVHTRFFYADAALDGYLREKITGYVGIDEFVRKLFDTMALVSRAISSILHDYHHTKPSR